MKFQGINFFQMLKSAQFNEFEISGENIISMNSHFEGISIPSSGKLISLKITPLPLKKLNVDLFFRGTDVVLSDVTFEYFEGFGTSLIRFTHPFIVIEFDFIKKRFNFSLKKFKRLRDLEEVIQLLLTLALGEEPLYVYLKEDEKEVELLQMSPSENIGIRNELNEIIILLEFLKSIQKHYRIVFRDFELDLSDETIEKINLLELHMNKNSAIFNSIFLSTKDLNLNEVITNYETLPEIEDLIINQQHFGFRISKKIHTINLLNQKIEINEELSITCNDAFISKTLDPTNLQDRNDNQYLELKSANEGIEMGFSSKKTE